MITSIRFGGNIRICILSRNHVFCQKFFPIGITQHLSHETPGWQPRLIVNESDGVHGRVPAAASLCFALAKARKPSLSASLGWAQEAQKRHARNSDGDATIVEVLSYPLCFRSRFAWLPWHLADRAGCKIGLATAMVFFEAPPPGYAVL